MVSRIYFDEPQNLEEILPRYKIFDSESEVYEGVYYGMSDYKFAVLISEGALFWPLHETPKAAKRLIPGVKEEVIELYKIIKEKRLDKRWRS